MPDSAGTMGVMSELRDDDAVPEWTLGWRLNRALSHAGISAAAMAEDLGVSRATVSRWINDHGAPPRVGYVKLWALRTGVSLEWLLEWRPERGKLSPSFDQLVQLRRAPIFTPVPGAASVTRIHPELAA